MQQSRDMSFILLQTFISTEMNGVIFLDDLFWQYKNEFWKQIVDTIDQKVHQHRFFYYLFKLSTQSKAGFDLLSEM